MNEASRRLVTELAQESRTLSAEAVYYWERHEPRYCDLLTTVDRMEPGRKIVRILDIGMGFQTLLLARRFPLSAVDVLGVYDDERYRPPGPYVFHRVDLNRAARETPAPLAGGGEYDLVVFMEVLEHLYTPPHLVFRYLASQMTRGGLLITTTPNAAWLKNRLKLLRGKNPFELLKPELADMGHIREYTGEEIAAEIKTAGLRLVSLERRGLYRFNNPKDNFYSWLADRLHPSLSRTLVAVAEKT